MAQQLINTGTVANDGTGQTLRTAFDKVNSNFTDLYNNNLVTSGILVLPTLTTTERNALTAVNGMLIYNTTDGKFQGYSGSAWGNISLT